MSLHIVLYRDREEIICILKGIVLRSRGRKRDRPGLREEVMRNLLGLRRVRARIKIGRWRRVVHLSIRWSMERKKK